MSIAWDSLLPWHAVAGGVAMGIAASMFALVNGRVAGISGILGGLLRPSAADVSWRTAFVAGLLVSPFAGALFGMPATPVIDAGYPTLVAAGLAVGIGTRYASGCTSGHGVCGVARLSPRSIVATLAFTAAGAVTVYVTRHVLAN